MPRFRIIQIRAYKDISLVEAESEEAVRLGNYESIDGMTTDSWTESEEIEEVDEDDDSLE